MRENKGLDSKNLECLHTKNVQLAVETIEPAALRVCVWVTHSVVFVVVTCSTNTLFGQRRAEVTTVWNKIYPEFSSLLANEIFRAIE